MILKIVKNDKEDTYYNVYTKQNGTYQGIGKVEKLGTEFWEATNGREIFVGKTRKEAALKLFESFINQK